MESTLQEYFGDKAPAMPDNIKEVIVKFSPWVSLIFLVLAVPAIFAVLGLGAALAPAGMFAPQFGLQYVLGLALTIVTMVLEALAIPGLMKRQMKGWRFAYYAALVSLVQSLVSLNLVGLVLGALISFYVLFQIKPKYQ